MPLRGFRAQPPSKDTGLAQGSPDTQQAGHACSHLAVGKNEKHTPYETNRDPTNNHALPSLFSMSRNQCERYSEGTKVVPQTGTLRQLTDCEADAGEQLPATRRRLTSGGLQAMFDFMCPETQHGGGCRSHRYQLRLSLSSRPIARTPRTVWSSAM